MSSNIPFENIPDVALREITDGGESPEVSRQYLHDPDCFAEIVLEFYFTSWKYLHVNFTPKVLQTTRGLRGK